MDMRLKLLDSETQLLVGIGAAVAAGCIPCLEKMARLADEAAIDSKKLRGAAIIGQFVKDQPAAQVKTTADLLFGTHLARSLSPASCTAGDQEERAVGCCDTGSEASQSCGCISG